MKVILQAPFFVNGSLIMPGLHMAPVYVPDGVKLPKSAQVVDAQPVADVLVLAPDRKNLLSQFDADRVNSDRETRVLLQSEFNRLEQEAVNAEKAAYDARGLIETATSGGQKKSLEKKAEAAAQAAVVARQLANETAKKLDSLVSNKE